MNQAIIRKRLIQEREALPPEIAAQNSQRIVERLKAFAPLLEALQKNGEAVVGLYAALRGEPDICPLTGFLAAQGATVAFPAIVNGPLGRCIQFGIYDPAIPLTTFLQTGCFNILEPPIRSFMPLNQAMDILIVPGVAFDEQGGRIGFGKGFYDRMIAALPVRPLLIGVAHPFQLQTEPIPLKDCDQRMDYIILPDRSIVVQWTHEGK
jgi:5-formyltetrahydrofolate cyclo-ligase